MDKEAANLLKNCSGLHIHFVGIKGTGMAALVEILYARNAKITGSDVSERFYTDSILEKYQITALPFSEKNISEDVKLVIYSSAYNPDTNPDLKAALKCKIPMLLYSEALGAISSASNAYSVGVCGVHGKTTTTGLVGTLLKAVNLNAQVLAGSIISSFGDSCTMTAKAFDSEKKHYFVAETCEYQRHFLAFEPQKIILTSVESDHQDYYPTFTDIQAAFVDYICKLPPHGQVFYCADDSGASQTIEIVLKRRADIQAIPYGTNAKGDYKIVFGDCKNGFQFFTIDAIGECALCVPGDHMVRNAAASVALCLELLREDKKDSRLYLDTIRTALRSFTGGKRRSEIIGRAKTKMGKEVIFIDDYGHHPTAIKTTLSGYKNFYSNYKIIVDFMSHTYSRTLALFTEFAQSFQDADSVILNKIYASARENPKDANISGEDLALETKKYHKDVYYCPEFEEATLKGIELLNKNTNSDGYIFVTMGAGNNWKVGQEILKML